ncbi:hypothetical protein TNCV_1863241 [Trichonephila clavipes]|nr:hypothetical protein TNCV_1863241 [Trichonephila clavipes]
MAQLTAQYNVGSSARVSERTVHRALLDYGPQSKRPTSVHVIIKRHCQLRLRWPRNIINGPWISVVQRSKTAMSEYLDIPRPLFRNLEEPVSSHLQKKLIASMPRQVEADFQS